MKVDVVLVTMRQRTEGRLADRRCMLDFTVNGLDGVGSVGERLGVGGAPLVALATINHTLICIGQLQVASRQEDRS